MLTPEQRAAIRAEDKAGASISEIAQRMGLSIGAVSGSLRGGRKRIVDQAVIDRIQAYDSEGMPDHRIAATLGIAESTVKRYLRPGVFPSLEEGMATATARMARIAADRVAAASGDDPEDLAPAPGQGFEAARTRAAMVDMAEARSAMPEQMVPTERQVRVWEAVQRLGFQADAARELGMAHGSVQSALHGYMRAKGLTGDLPGYMPPGEKVRREQEARASRAQGYRLGADHAKTIPPAAPTEPSYVAPTTGKARDMIVIPFDQVYEHGYRIGWMAAALVFIAEGRIMLSEVESAAHKALSPPAPPSWPIRTIPDMPR